MRFRSKTGRTLGSLYLGLYGISGIYAVCVLVLSRPRWEFDPAAIVALPWTVLILPVAYSLGIREWYQRHAGDPVLYGTVMTLIMLPGALLNALILYWFGKLLDGRRKP